MRNWLSIFVVLCVSGFAGVSYAFPRHSFYTMPADGQTTDMSSSKRAGGGGIFGTGGKRDFGIKCSHCHINNAGQQTKSTLKVTLTPTPAWQTISGKDAYKPGQKYTMKLSLIGERLGAANMDPGDSNGLALTIEDGAGKLAGVLESDSGQSSATCSNTDPFPYPMYPTMMKYPPAATTVLTGDCKVMLSLDQAPPTIKLGEALTDWSFTWTAPAKGAGDLTIFYGVVDGDSSGKSSLDDDVKEGTIPLAEGS